jgi:hypothetical protein
MPKEQMYDLGVKRSFQRFFDPFLSLDANPNYYKNVLST